MPTIVCLGDSITAGYPYTKDKSWVYLCQEKFKNKLNLNLINAGVSNDTVEDMLARYDVDVSPHNPDAVIILAGTNDAWQGIPLEVTKINFKQLLQKIKDNNAIPVLGLPAPIIKDILGVYYQLQNVEMFNQQLDDIRNWIKEYALDNGLNVLNFYQFLCRPGTDQGKTELYCADGGHPNIKGYAIIAQNVEKQMFELVRALQVL